MKTIDEDIRNGQYKTMYLLYGDEAYLKKQYKDKLIKALVAEGDTMNFSAYEGKGINPKELIDLAETLPFFAERRVILVENSGFFKNSCDDLAEYLLEPAASTCFLFVEEEVDKRSKMYKAVAKAGKAVEFGTQNEELLTRWILSRLKKENKNITGNVMQLFINMFCRILLSLQGIFRQHISGRSNLIIDCYIASDIPLFKIIYDRLFVIFIYSIH